MSSAPATSATPGPPAIWLVHLDGKPPTLVTSDSSLNLAPQWSPDGRDLYWISDREAAATSTASRSMPTGAPVGTPAATHHRTDAQGLSLSRRGDRMAYSRLSNWSTHLVHPGARAGARLGSRRQEAHDRERDDRVD